MKPTSIEARRRALVTKMQTEGAEVAYETALDVCRDKKAPAPARATCATVLLRGGGYLNAKSVDLAPKEAHEMSYDELDAAVAASVEALESWRRGGEDREDEPEDGPDDLGVLG